MCLNILINFLFIWRVSIICLSRITQLGKDNWWIKWFSFIIQTWRILRVILARQISSNMFFLSLPFIIQKHFHRRLGCYSYNSHTLSFLCSVTFRVFIQNHMELWATTFGTKRRRRGSDLDRTSLSNQNGGRESL